MSRPDYGSMLERFNATGGRGDVLSFSREDAARLAELPLEIAAPILHALLKWFLTGEDVRLDDPRDRAMLAGFKEHQLGNAARRGKFLNDQKEKSDKAVQARKERNPRDTHGTPTDNPRETQVIDKAKDKDSVKEKSLSLAGDGTERGGLTPPVCPSPLSAEEAKKVLAMDAKVISSHPEVMNKSGTALNALGYKFANATPDVALLMTAEELYPNDVNLTVNQDDDDEPSVLAQIAETNDTIENYDETIPKSFYKTPGGRFVKSAMSVYDEIYNAYLASDEDTALNKSDDVFKRAILAAAIDSKDPKVENRAGFILARLQKVAAAVKVLEAAKSRPLKEQLSDADY